MTDDATTRRRLVAALAAFVAALFGAGFGTSWTFMPPGDGDDGFDLSVDFDAEREDPSRPSPTPTGTPTETPGDGNPTAPSSDGRTTDGTATSTVAFPRDPDGDPRTAAPATPTPAVDSPSLATAATPLTLSNLHPGDSGTLTATLSLSGAPARLWVRGDVTGVDERGLTEPELIAGDDDATGELQTFVDVSVWYVDDGTRVSVYDGPLTGLPAAWTSLADGCFDAGDHALYLRWAVDADAPNAIQSDAVTVSFGVAASSCA